MPSSTAGGGVGRPAQEGAAAAPLLRLPTDKGTEGSETEPQSRRCLGENCGCNCGGSKGEELDGLGTLREEGGGGGQGGCCGIHCCRNRKNKEDKEGQEDPPTPSGRVRPVITFSHVEGGGHRGVEGKDTRSRSPSPLLEIPTPVDTAKEIMRPPSTERT